MYIELINKVKEENVERIHHAFEEVCTFGVKNDIVEFVKSFDFDVNNDDGNFMEIIACRNDFELFKTMIELGGNINSNGSLNIFARKGNLDAVKYIIEELRGDYTAMFGATALTNYDHIKEYVCGLSDEYFICLLVEN